MISHARPAAAMLSVLLAAAALLVVSPAAVVAATAGSTTPAGPPGTRCVPPPIAHRGDSFRAPENTLPAYRTALSAGVLRLEVDVRFSADGVPVLMHDATVERTTNGAGAVAELTFESLRSLDAGSWFAPRYAGVQVPTLAEVLGLGRSRGAHFLVELKARPTPEQLTAVMAVLGQPDLNRRTMVTSFDEQTILEVRAAAPHLPTAIIDDPRYRDPESVLRFGSTYLVNWASVTADRAEVWRAAGIAIRPWTVDSVRGWKRMAWDDADAVITNRPSRYLSWARSVCG